MYCFQNPDWPTRFSASFWLQKESDEKISFTLGELALCAPYHWIPSNFAKVQGALDLVKFFSSLIKANGLPTRPE